MAVTIAMFNTSGGVGKTTSTHNIGYHMGRDLGQKVLLVDMDPQASLTTFLGLVPFDLEVTIYNSLIEKKPLPIVTGEEVNEIVCCDISPTNIYMARAEMELNAQTKKEERLADRIREIGDQYDFILVDCPPSLGNLSICCLCAADFLCIPIQTEYKSLEATVNLLQVTFEIARDVNPKLSVVGVLPTKSNASFKNAVIFQPIPRRIDIAKASAAHVPLAKFDSDHAAIQQFQDVAKLFAGLK